MEDISPVILLPVMIGNKLMAVRCREPVVAVNRYEPTSQITHELFD